MARDFDVDWLEDDESGELSVFFSDEAANNREALVARSAAVIATFPGVESAYQSDREQILVSGPSLDPRAVESMLEAWWTDQLGGS